MFETEWIPAGKPLFKLRVCINKRLNTDRIPSCGGRGSRELADRLEKMILAENLPVELVRSPCMNNCLIGPNLKIQGGKLFNLKEDVSDARIEEIMAALRAEAERLKKIAAENTPS